MRPIARGDCPVNEFKEYKDSLGFLVKRLGELCSYCEQYLGAGLAVEHIRPKKLSPNLCCCWENFLLACPNCNSTKGDTLINDDNVTDYLWPDYDNTFLAIVYEENGFVKPNPELPPEIQEKAQRLIKLVGLDKYPSDNPQINPKMKDRRWSNRRATWDKAVHAKTRLAQVNSEEMRAQIEDTANSFFSVWMTVFADDPDMRRRLIQKFVGTAQDCFDENGVPCRRPGGQI